ncbi:hypothetical protein [uncultured Holdemanella sp.]|mgnify:CR=1 FL=1|uniref:hypothetical protein n=1 Tax=uncultured Holdemanella sp. TaxID=1763549 RepID=UPI0025D14D32|nr:hypothetical protein [uncultured Holdemanella sp.]
MKKSKIDQQIADVLVYQDKMLSEIYFPNEKDIDDRILESELLLRSLKGDVKFVKEIKMSSEKPKPVVTYPSWDFLRKEAENYVGTDHDLNELFTKEELQSNEKAILQLNNEYNEIHKLDKIDVSIAVVAGLAGAFVDTVLVGIPSRTTNGLKAAPLSNYIRGYFDKRFPEEEMSKLANKKISKVPFDAQDNRNTTVWVEGLSAYYHRMLQLGHDPLLGFVVGILDILNGTMTTIDKQGNIVCQVMENYEERKESDIFSAMCKQIIHLKTDITTSMGLPVPLMSLFNLLQFGDIGEEEQTIAEIVQGMYYEGYDFVHFCSMSIPVMVTEVIVRLCYAIKRIKEGNSIRESIPFSLNRNKNPKLSTMLFIGQSSATAINAGKVAFTKNPLEINYPQWIAFAKYSYTQLKWGLINKPKLREEYVLNKIHEELHDVMKEIDCSFDEFIEGKTVVVMN